MNTSTQQIDTNTTLTDEHMLVDRSVINSDQLDVCVNDVVIAYLEVDEMGVTVNYLNSEFESNSNSSIIESKALNFLYLEDIQDANENAYNEYYAAKNSETISIY